MAGSRFNDRSSIPLLAANNYLFALLHFIMTGPSIIRTLRHVNHGLALFSYLNFILLRSYSTGGFLVHIFFLRTWALGHFWALTIQDIVNDGTDYFISNSCIFISIIAFVILAYNQYTRFEMIVH